MRPLYVWLGTSTAFIVYVTVAVTAGDLLPSWVVSFISAPIPSIRWTRDDRPHVGPGPGEQTASPHAAFVAGP
ncbi:hypothetical protein [Streptomyces sp. NBC_00075]|uniref:hypothetical protein n=1 Tax=Streptomyces sp. NBC_00075 TaxID=2975641 RepID=UPI0038671B09